LKGSEVHKFKTDIESQLNCFLQTEQNKSISKTWCWKCKNISLSVTSVGYKRNLLHLSVKW